MKSITMTTLLALVAAVRLMSAGADGRGPLVTYLSSAFAAMSSTVVQAAEMMPEADYSYRPPGVDDEVRTFRQLIDHITNVNEFICQRIRGEVPALAPPAMETTKSGAVRRLKTSIAACDTTLASLTDEQALKMRSFKGTDGSTNEFVSANPAIFLIAHGNEHYGNIVTYLRAKGLTPPAGPAQATWGKRTASR